MYSALTLAQRILLSRRDLDWKQENLAEASGVPINAKRPPLDFGRSGERLLNSVCACAFQSTIRPTANATKPASQLFTHDWGNGRCAS